MFDLNFSLKISLRKIWDCRAGSSAERDAFFYIKKICLLVINKFRKYGIDIIIALTFGKLLIKNIL